MRMEFFKIIFFQDKYACTKRVPDFKTRKINNNNNKLLGNRSVFVLDTSSAYSMLGLVSSQGYTTQGS